MRFYVAVVEGDQCHRLEEVLRAWGYAPTGAVEFLTDWKSVGADLNQPGWLGAALSDGWTVLVDDGALACAVFDDPILGRSLAGLFGRRVVSAVADDRVGCYGFRIYSPEGLIRSVCFNENDLIDNAGEPFPGEPSLEDYGTFDVLDVLHLLGIDIEAGVEQTTRAALVRFDSATPEYRRTNESSR